VCTRAIVTGVRPHISGATRGSAECDCDRVRQHPRLSLSGMSACDLRRSDRRLCYRCTILTCPCGRRPPVYRARLRASVSSVRSSRWLTSCLFPADETEGSGHEAASDCWVSVHPCVDLPITRDVGTDRRQRVGAHRRLHVAVANYYQVPEREVVVIREQRISDDELPVVLFIAREARVPPARVIEMRQRGRSCGTSPCTSASGPTSTTCRWRDAPGPPYGHAYGHYKKRGLSGRRSCSPTTTL
jgi:hypothetical protein